MGLRDNFRQAIDEMIGAKPADSNKPDRTKSVSPYPAPVDQNVNTNQLSKSATINKTQSESAITSISNHSVRSEQRTGSKSIISMGTLIKGDLICESDLDVQGAIIGNVKNVGLIRITGKVEGDIECENLELENAVINGQITVNKHMVMRGESVVVGNVTSEQMEVCGKIKGNISVNATLHLLSKSSVLGDIHASTIQIDAGAKVFGHLNITSSSEAAAEANQILE